MSPVSAFGAGIYSANHRGYLVPHVPATSTFKLALHFSYSLCVPRDSHNKYRLYPHTALNCCSTVRNLTAPKLSTVSLTSVVDVMKEGGIYICWIGWTGPIVKVSTTQSNFRFAFSNDACTDGRRGRYQQLSFATKSLRSSLSSRSFKHNGLRSP